MRARKRPSSDPRWRRLLAVRRLSWPLIDQVIWSASNVGAIVLAARMLDQRAFGAFSIATVTYTLALGASRSLSTEPLLVRSGSGAGTVEARRAAAVTASLWAGLTLGFITLVAGGLAQGQVRGALVGLGVCLPGLLAQDAWRYGQFLRQGAHRAAACDAAWLLMQLAFFATLRARGAHDAGSFVAAWGMAGAITGIVCITLTHDWSNRGLGLRWIRTNRDLGARYLVDFLCGAGTTQLTLYALAAFAGLAAAGSFRGAQALFGPISVLLTAVYITLVPEGQKAFRRSPRVFIGVSVGVSAAFSAMAFGLMLALLSLPDPVGTELLGTSWRGARVLILPFGLATCGAGAIVGPAVGLRSLGDARRVLRARLISLPFVLVLPFWGTVDDGARGLSRQLAVATWLSVGIYWQHLIAATRVAGADDSDAAVEPAVAADPTATSRP